LSTERRDGGARRVFLLSGMGSRQRLARFSWPTRGRWRINRGGCNQAGPRAGEDGVAFRGASNKPQSPLPMSDRIRLRWFASLHGILEPKRPDPVEQWMVTNWKTPLGDFRDW